ncbi:MAG TPA: CDP-alcohol phosphatidyltransferase family protein, partial [Micromonosporaceae bacterium]|nr:CDP-alcohol phosphatidyltransferase family protein [Micromonosporaceae bacterium]
MRTVRLEVIIGGLATPALLTTISLTTGLSVAGWVFGIAVGWTATALLAMGRVRSDEPDIQPADWITLVRALLTAGVAALVADSFVRPAHVTTLIVIAGIAIALDAVDGQVARRTGTATALGARFDGEVDAFLILVLSVAVSRDLGGWVIAIGAMRYAFLVAAWLVPWMAAPLPPRYWGKVVAAVQAIVLTVVASGALPRLLSIVAVGLALVLLVESFGHNVVWLYRNGAGPTSRKVVRRSTAIVALGIVWLVVVAPDRLERLTPVQFIRVPIEALVLVALALLLPRRPRRVVAIIAGVAFGVLTIVKLLDVVFFQELGRPFNPVLDWGNLGPGIGVVRDSIGTAATYALLVVAVVGLALIVALITVAAVRVCNVAARHRRGSVGGIAVLGVVWGLTAALSLQVAQGATIASAATFDLAVSQVRDGNASVRDQQRFEQDIHAADPYARIPASNLLTDLRGKDVLVVFVESYGQVAVQGTTFSPGVDAVLQSGNGQLAAAGYSARSAWLTSPTFGGISWLAHSTLQSGLWVNNQQRYNQLVASDRFTLSDAFKDAGWRTVSDVPSDDTAWPPGTSFYHYDQLYDRRNVGYRGPTFSYASMPDQFSLAAFQRLELTPGHAPVMAEIDLVSSHTPWTPLPHMVPWNQLGDGSIFNPMPAQGLTPAVAWKNTDTVRQLYGQSIQYSMTALISWVTQMHDNNLVLVLLGDHQPATTVSRPGANHQVPISIVAHDPSVLADISS